MKLIIEDLHVSYEGKEILKGINLEAESGKITTLMGPNGSGKTTLSNVLLGNPNYKIEKGSIIFNDEDITNLSPDERAKKGLFLSFQQPVEIEGVTVANFLRTTLNSVRKEPIQFQEFQSLLKKSMDKLKIDPKFSTRNLNEGFSGGEKKKNEMLQLLMFNPSFAILDETDSGLDTDALKLIGTTIQEMVKENNLGILLITHYNKLFQYVKPDIVYIILDGKVVEKGNEELIKNIEDKGYDIVNQVL